MKGQLIGKDFDMGKDCRQKEKRAAEDEIVGRHHQFNGHDLSNSGDSVGKGSLACYSLWGHRGSDMTQQLNNKGTREW